MALSTGQPGAYVLQTVFRLPENLDLDRFRAAWEAAVESTEILRTRIIHVEKTLQVVLKDKLRWRTAENLAEYLEEDKMLPIEYGKELTRYAIVGACDGAGERHMVWTVHHAIYDGFSMSLILDKVERIYTRREVIKAAPFSGFIDYLEKVDVEESNKFWRTQLEDTATPSFPQSSSLFTRVNKSLTHSIKLSRESVSGITISSTIRAAWALVISKYSSSDDAVFGATLTGRNAPIFGITTMIGPTIATVPIRVRIDPKRPMTDFLADIQEQATRMIPFEHTGLQHIKRLSNGARAACAFQNLLVIQPLGEGATQESTMGLQVAAGAEGNFHTYALVLECRTRKGGIDFSADYDAEVISATQMQRILHQLEHVLRQVTSGDKCLSVGNIEVYSKEDEIEVLGWNGSLPVKIDSCVHEVISKQVLARPQAPAISAWDGDFTYGELDELSTRLAHHLVTLGVGPEVIVPLCFEKSAWTVVAMLGVLKAGGACVSLEPSHPMMRLEGIIQEVGTNLILVAPQLEHRFSGLIQDVLMVSRTYLSSLPTTSGASISASVRSENAAFVIFTSGSTGKPKGVVLEHASVCTSVDAHGSALGIDETSRVLQFAAYVFDISIQDIFTTLMRGGCVCVPSDHDRVNDLAGAINRLGVNWACITPTVASLLRPSDMPTLKALTLAGEAVTQKVVDIWGGLGNLNNCYGPAESTIYCAWNGRVGKTGMPSNIGRGLSSLLWVVEPTDHDLLTPVGCIGELLLEGPLLARGYLNDPGKTATSFITDPLWAKNAGFSLARRFYKTGDLVRYNSDGTLDYLGRKDTQVKLHGQRLELGEVEHHLQSVNSIQNVIVMVPTQGRCQERLVAVTALEGFGLIGSTLDSVLQSNQQNLQIIDDSRKELAASEVSEVQKHLSDHLPSYMVPTIWIIVDSIPQNTSGKLDRAAVAQWVQDMDEATYLRIINGEEEEDAKGIATTAMDRRLQEVLGRVLNLPVERIVLSKSFLSLGGDSITAMQAVSRARAEGVVVRVQDFLQSKSISELALVAKLSTKSSISHADEVEAIFDLSPVQQMYFQMAGQKANQFNQSFFLRFTRDTDAQHVARALEAVVRQHSMLRARFRQAENGRWCQLITKDVAKSYHFRLYETNEDEVAAVMAATQTSLDIEYGPVFAADMFNVAGGGQLLFLVAHHLVMDLVSWRVVIHDLEEILESGTVTAEKPFPFQAWCKLQAEHAQKYLLPENVLPVKVEPADQAFWGMENQSNVYRDVVGESFILDANLTSTLLGPCQEALGTEPVEVFLGTLLQAFSSIFNNRSTPTIFGEGHGREPWDDEVDLSETVGWFTTMSPLHVAVKNGAHVVDTVRRTKDARRKIPGNGWPYFASRFLNSEGIKAFSKHLPMEVLFNYLGRYQQLERQDTLLKQEPMPGAASDIGLDVPRLALIEVSVVVIHGVTRFSVLYNRHMQHQDDISGWMQAWEQSLREAARLLSRMDVERTLSDFPLLSLSYSGLEKLKNERFPQIGVKGYLEVQDIYPCSPIQQGLLLSQTKKSGAYEIAFTFEAIPAQVSVPVDVERLISAWQQVVNRHAILRTVFVDSVSEDGIFDQVVLKHVDASVVKYDSVNTDTGALAALKEQQPMDHTESRPGHRLTVCQTKSGNVFYRLEINHAIIDAASISLIQRDMAFAYEGVLQPGPGPLYSKYIKYLGDRPLYIAIDHWKGYLAGMEPCHFPLLTGADDSRKLSHMPINLDLPSGALQGYCERNGVTISNMVQTVWGLVLRCFCNSDQVCFGYLSSGRNAPVESIDETVGPFINMMVSRVDARGATRVTQLVKQVQDGYLAGLEHQHCSLAQIQHGLTLEGRPLFNTVMSIQRALDSDTDGDDKIEIPAISFKSLTSHDPTEVNHANSSRNRNMVLTS
jgi:amino acid adenylation domain-containing protein/non-ribosomal peptide synthase protein (TIGR01720 family)